MTETQGDNLVIYRLHTLKDAMVLIAKAVGDEAMLYDRYHEQSHK